MAERFEETFNELCMEYIKDVEQSKLTTENKNKSKITKMNILKVVENTEKI